eukprot:SAG31_NODE_3573_length_4113_cov_4.139013_4_plen_107_part_00
MILAVTGGSRLSLASLGLPAHVLVGVIARVTGVGSHIVLDSVTVPEQPALGVLTGVITATTAAPSFDPPNFCLHFLSWSLVHVRWLVGACALGAGQEAIYQTNAVR